VWVQEGVILAYDQRAGLGMREVGFGWGRTLFWIGDVSDVLEY
jgi:hypothetical protein